MYFNAPYTGKAKVIDAVITESPYRTPGALAVNLLMKQIDGECQDYWVSELSDSVNPKMNHRRQVDITLEDLSKLAGRAVTLLDMEDLSFLIGKETVILVEASNATKEDGTPFYNVKRINYKPGLRAEKLSGESLKAKLAALGAGSAQQPVPQPPAPATGKNPFDNQEF